MMLTTIYSAVTITPHIFGMREESVLAKANTTGAAWFLAPVESFS